MSDAARWRNLVVHLVRIVRRTVRDVISNVRGPSPDHGAAVVPLGIGAAALTGLGIAIALLVHMGSSREDINTMEQDPRPGLVRPVALRDFQFPEMHLYGPEGDFYRVRDPHEPWAEDEVERLRLDTESKAVDIIGEQNRELLLELLNMQQ